MGFPILTKKRVKWINVVETLSLHGSGWIEFFEQTSSQKLTPSSPDSFPVKYPEATLHIRCANGKQV